MQLTFDPEAHRYWIDGRPVPSVTAVLEPLFDWTAVPFKVLERKRQIGQAVHQAIHMELTGGVDPASIDEQCRPYFQAWQRFREECEFEPVLVEHRVCFSLAGLEYAGTLDEWGKLQGQDALVDWKCSMFLNIPAVGAQTAAYLYALCAGPSGYGSLSDKRFAVKLGGDGRYKLERFRALDEDLQRFMHYLLRYKAEREGRIWPKPTMH